MTYKNLLILGSILLCLSNSSHAQSTLNPIVVSSSAKPIDIYASPSSLEVLTSEEIKRKGYKNIFEILNSLTSINISTTGGGGQTTSIFTRGTESNHTKIIYDGVELNPGTLGLAPIQNISIDSIDKIEIIMGSSSALHGANSIGGVINIVSKNKTKSVSISSGSWSTNIISFLDSTNYNNLDIQLTASRKESKSFPAKTSSNKRHSYNTENISLKMAKAYKSYQLSSKIHSSRGNTQYDSFGSNLNQNHEDYFYTIDAKKYINDDMVNFNYIKSQNKIIQSAPSATDFTKTIREKYGLAYTKVDKNVVSKLGIAYTKEHMSELSYGTRYITSPIIKEFYYHNDDFSKSFNFNYGIRAINHSQFGSFVLGNFGLSTQRDEYVYTFNINRAFRAPDATDLYGYGGNINLEPEESFSYEFSLRRLLKQNEMIRTTLFQTRIKNLIETDSNSVQYIAKSKITGMEFKYQLRRNLFNYNFSYTYMIPKDISNNQYLSKRSKHKVNLNIGFTINESESINYNVVGEGGRKASPFSNVELGSYFITDMNYNVKYKNNKLVLAVKNLFDKSYRTSHNYNMPDRSFFITYSYDY